MNRNDAIAFIRSRHNKYYYTSNDLRTMQKICQLDFIDELQPILNDYCQPLLYKKQKIVKYQIASHYQINDEEKASLYRFGGHLPIQKLQDEGFDIADVKYFFFDTPYHGSMKEVIEDLEKSRNITAIDFNGKDNDYRLHPIDLSDTNLKFALNVDIGDLLSGNIKLPKSLQYLELNQADNDKHRDLFSDFGNRLASYYHSAQAVVGQYKMTIPGSTEALFDEVRDHIHDMVLKFSQKKKLKPGDSNRLNPVRKWSNPVGQVGFSAYCNTSSSLMVSVILQQDIAMKNAGTLDFPNLLGYKGMIEVLSENTKKNLRMWQPCLGFWLANRHSLILAPVLIPHIDYHVVPHCPNMKGILFDQLTFKGDYEEKFEHIATVEDSFDNGAYFMEMFT